MLISTRNATTTPAGVQVNHWRALPVLMAGTAMIVLDFFIVNVALPSIQSGLHASASALEWVVAGYGLTFSTLLITAGRLGDQVGRRRMFAIGLALFAITSAGCGLAPTAGALVVFRFLQGGAAAIISPTVLAIIGVVFTGEDRVRAITIYGIVLGVAAAAGQLVGGILIQADIFGLGWRAIFLINVPIGAAALALTPKLVPESRATSTHRLDLIGTILLTAALTAIVLPLIEGRRLGWPAWTWVSLAAGPVLLATFAGQQARMRQAGGAPLLDLQLFRSRAFSAGLVTQMALWCGQASFFLILALYLQDGRGLDPLQAGLVFTIAAGAYLVASMRAPALTMRWGRRLVAGGALILAAGHGLLLAAVALNGTGGSIADLAPGLLLVGAGMGLCITPLTTTVLASAGPESAGSVSGALSTMQQVGNSLGVAVTGVIFFGALSGGYAHAFLLGLAELAALLVGVAALTRLLPRPTAAEGDS